jgi:rhodanese-related sulfurtransferase
MNSQISWDMNRFSKNILISLIMLLSNPLFGQDAYDIMLRALYKNSVPLIQASALSDKLEKNNVTILDTRSLREFEVSHIQNSKFVDYDNFDASMVDDIDKSAEVVVYCSVGYRSERIAEKLQTLGFKNVKNLYGGIFTWKNEGNEVVNSNDKITEEVHAYNLAWGIWLKKGVKVYE